MMFVFIVTAAFTVDYAYMQLVRTELRSATDAAAKAGAEALSRTQDANAARFEAIRYAAANSVGGRPFRLNNNDITIGRVSSNANGKWNFQAGGSPPNAVRVNSRTGNGYANEAVPLYFSGVLGQSGFTPQCQSTAGQQDVEVCLCLDRSGSMNFDMSGVDYSFPSGNPHLSSFTGWGWDWRNMLSRPHPSQSRWAALTPRCRCVSSTKPDAIIRNHASVSLLGDRTIRCPSIPTPIIQPAPSTSRCPPAAARTGATTPTRSAPWCPPKPTSQSWAVPTCRRLG